MMRSTTQQATGQRAAKPFGARRHGARLQSGQALVILALGFIGLVGFVGIVTDVSLLFVRYSTLRRAVDAAAVSAAGQMRRTVDPTPLTAGDALGRAEGESVAALNLAARQFIEVYGLTPTNVLVETCRSQSVQYVNHPDSQLGDPVPVPVDAGGNLLFRYFVLPANSRPRVVMGDANGDGSINAGDNGVNGTPQIDPADTGTPGVFDQEDTINNAADEVAVRRYLQLCTSDEQKRVRVTAQIASPTVFLSLLGLPQLTLTESAISQTAVIDAVLIMDSSESMLTQTGYDDWENIGLGRRYVPLQIPQNDDPTFNNPRIHTLLTRNQCQLTYNDTYPSTMPDPTDPTGECAAYNEGIPPDNPLESFFPGPGGLTNDDSDEPRPFCRVRAYPYSMYNVGHTIIGGSGTDGQYASDLAAYLGASFDTRYVPFPDASGQNYFNMYVPQYNYFGCCNDPNGDMDFSDLICQPFGDARDAALGFFDRLDFLRGDRVGIVTFDRRAHIVDPDGSAGSQSPMMESDTPIGGTIASSLVRRGARSTMLQEVGVRAEPTYYSDSDNNGRWNTLMDTTQPRDYAGYMSEEVGNIRNAPTYNSCPFDQARMQADWDSDADPEVSAFYTRYHTFARRYNIGPNYPFREVGGPSVPPGPDQRLLDDIDSVPAWFASTLGTGYSTSEFSYEYWASCSGSNLGAGLAGASAILYGNGRREGAVWIMVMLSDGAAGASDPLARQLETRIVNDGSFTNDNTRVRSVGPPVVRGSTLSQPANPYGELDTSVPAIYRDEVAYIAREGEYGGLGACPYSADGVSPRSRLLPADADLPVNGSSDELTFPYCTDPDPRTRNFCTSYPDEPSTRVIDLDYRDPSVGSLLSTHSCNIDLYNFTDSVNYPDQYAEADERGYDAGDVYRPYDPDDYARDWADWIGLADLPGEEARRVRPGAQQLPVIFTIGYNMTFEGGSDPRVQGNTRDYLGEEILRYIADVGDNNRIDDDYWQHILGARIPNQTSENRSGGPEIFPSVWDSSVPEIAGVTYVTNAAQFGTRGSCQMPLTTDNVAVRTTYAPLTPETNCGNYYNASSRTALVEVFNDIASRMFTRLSQ